MPCTSRATRVCTRSFPRNGPETAICAIPPCGGTDAGVHFFARTATRSSKWISARMGRSYTVPADQFFFLRREQAKPYLSSTAALRYGRRSIRVQTDGVGQDRRVRLGTPLRRGRTSQADEKRARLRPASAQIAQDPDGYYPVRGAQRRYPLSTYIKKKAARQDQRSSSAMSCTNTTTPAARATPWRSCTAPRSSVRRNDRDAHQWLLLRYLSPALPHRPRAYAQGWISSIASPGDFDAEYGVVENAYETRDAEYNANRRASKRKTRSRQLPGVSPLVFSRFLLEYAAFLSLYGHGKGSAEL